MIVQNPGWEREENEIAPPPPKKKEKIYKFYWTLKEFVSLKILGDKAQQWLVCIK